jgi:hypothetical protein
VHCEDLLINDSCDGQAVEAVGEGLPQLNVESTLAWEEESDRGEEGNEAASAFHFY